MPIELTSLKRNIDNTAESLAFKKYSHLSFSKSNLYIWGTKQRLKLTREYGPKSVPVEIARGGINSENILCLLLYHAILTDIYYRQDILRSMVHGIINFLFDNIYFLKNAQKHFIKRVSI